MVDTDNGDGSSRSHLSFHDLKRRGLLEQQRGNPPVTPPCGPLDKVPSEPLMKETEEYSGRESCEPRCYRIRRVSQAQ